MIDTVLLDLDDTILDFHKSEAFALKKTLEELGIEPLSSIIERYSEINDAQWSCWTWKDYKRAGFDRQIRDSF